MLIEKVDDLELQFIEYSGWSIRKGDNTYRLDEELLVRPFIFWLPLLENDPVKFVKKIDVKLRG